MKYPIGIQTFERIRTEGYLYVDKTKTLAHLVEEGGNYFLSRPRRFGKSLTLSTLKAAFEGKKELFEGLWLGSHYDFSQTYPVIHLDLSNLEHQKVGLNTALNMRLDEQAAKFGLKLHQQTPGWKLDELIKALAHRNQVVILIDEYDKPILDHLQDADKAREIRDELKSFYSPLKSLDPYLRLVMLTGVSKFSRMSVFSELNNLQDLTLNRHYADLTGYTVEELRHYFAEPAATLAQELDMSLAEFWDKVRQWYNGYSWDGKTRIYNPFSILLLFSHGAFGNYWFHTGTPTFLVNLLNRSLPYSHERIRTDEAGIEAFDPGRIAPIPLLFQTGYLTIVDRQEGVFTLDYPNKEVKASLFRYLLADLAHHENGEMGPIVLDMAVMLREHDLSGFLELLDGVFARIPGEIFLNQKEAYYQTVLYLVIGLLGFHVDCEPRKRRGRPDLIALLSDRVYVMEFKLDRPASEAIAQIREKGYGEQYRHDGRQVLLVGIRFDSARKGVGEWLVEAL